MKIGILAEEGCYPIPTPCTFSLWDEYDTTPWPELHYQPVTFSHVTHSPIQKSRVCLATDGGEKPCYLSAEIIDHHLRSGESTQSNPVLASKIQLRGKPGKDDCGHIIGAVLGGKMCEFNLFPQDKDISQGFKGLNKLWRKGVEFVMQMWLSLPKEEKPSVEFEMILYYEDISYPDRPNRAKLLITFKRDGEEKVDEQNDEDMEKVLDPVLTGQLLNEILVEDEIPEEVYDKMHWDNYSAHCGNRCDLYSKILEELLHAILGVREIPVPIPDPSPSTPSTSEAPAPALPLPRGSHTPFSYWDLVPIVSDLRSISQGWEDAEDGNRWGAVSHIALGVGGLAMTVVSLGASSILKEGSKLAIKEGSKEVIKEGGKQVGKGMARHLVKEVVKETVVTAERVAVHAIGNWVKSVVVRPRKDDIVVVEKPVE